MLITFPMQIYVNCQSMWKDDLNFPSLPLSSPNRPEEKKQNLAILIPQNKMYT